MHEALELAMGLSQLIRFSQKRTTLFETLQKQMSPGAPTLKPLCPTRWTVRTKAIDALLKNYLVLQKELEIVQQGKDEYAMKAHGFLTAMEKFRTFFGLKLSYLLFSATEQLSLTFQAVNTSIQQAVSASCLAVSFLERQRTDREFSLFYSNCLSEAKDLTDDPVMPRQRRPPRRIDDGATPHSFKDPKSLFRKHYFEALDIVIGELKNRFNQTRGMPLAAKLEKMFLDAANGTCNFNHGLPDELKLCGTDVKLDRLLIQLQMLPDLIQTYNKANPTIAIKKVTLVSTLCDAMNSISASKTMLSEVYKLLRILLAIPVTSATAERTFSALRRLKNYLRSTMTQPRLNNMMLLHIHKYVTDDLDLLQVAKEFVQVNDRRKNYFGTF